MTLQPTKLPRKTPKSRVAALAAIEHALIECAQKATEETDWNWQVAGVQCHQNGQMREVLIRLQPWAQGV